MRTDHVARNRVFKRKPNTTGPGPRDIWSLTPAAGSEMMSVPASKAIRLVDLALWFGRNQDVADLNALMAWFNALFNPGRADLLGTVYLTDIPAEYTVVPFAPEPIDQAAPEELGSLPAAPTISSTVADLVILLETRLHGGGYQLPPGLVRRVLTAWLRGDVVVLVGQPGTGKTMFAGLLGRAMEAELNLEPPLLIPISADFDESEFIGYERLDGTPQLRDFAREILLTSQPLEARVVVLEEFNLASIETYLASVLVATQEQERLVRLPAGGTAQLPVDTFLLATCNSYRDEPETRTRVSSPTKRRSTIITMPNVLGDRFDDDPEGAVLALASELIGTEQARVNARLAAHTSTQFDGMRALALNSVSSLDDLSDAVKASLTSVSSSILTTPAGRSWYTLGLLKDVVLEIVHAERNEHAELVALGQSVADKLVHQLRGSHADIQDFRSACALLPNAAEIALLVDRMMDGPSDELLPLL
jgi:MoxR-like ATPase